MAKANQQILTEEGKRKYEEELSFLINVESPKVIQELKEAREQGDLSENADYDAARRKQAETDARIKILQNLLDNATIITTSGNDVVALGSKVTLKFLDDGLVEEYHIVGTAEANPEEGKISNACKLSQSILGHKVGDVVTVKVDNAYDVEIVEISAE